ADRPHRVDRRTPLLLPAVERRDRRCPDPSGLHRGDDQGRPGHPRRPAPHGGRGGAAPRVLLRRRGSGALGLRRVRPAGNAGGGWTWRRRPRLRMEEAGGGVAVRGPARAPGRIGQTRRRTAVTLPRMTAWSPSIG